MSEKQKEFTLNIDERRLILNVMLTGETKVPIFASHITIVMVMIMMGDLYRRDIFPLMENVYYLLLAKNEILAKVTLLLLTEQVQHLYIFDTVGNGMHSKRRFAMHQ